ncbi:MAG: hybrid sensor histidine kinase/response regulator, partial [Bacteroidota bacterium]
FIERVRNHEKLQLLNQAVEQNPAEIMITDKEGHIKYVNKGFSLITGYSFADVYGRRPEMLRSEIHSERFFEEMWNTLLSGKVWSGEFRNYHRNGRMYWEQAIISPIFDKDNNITHFVKVSEDITEKKQMIEELKKAKEKAEESDRLKSAFLTNISHEIRTPMNGILGFINLIDETGLDEEERSEYIEIINKSGQRLLDTINDIVELSRIDAGESDIKSEKVDIHGVMKFHLHLFKPQATEKGLSLEIDKELPEEKSLVYTDKSRLEGMLGNLLKNAIKFTKEGKITFGNYIESDDVIFYVSDTGIGVPREKHEAIFERFVQADLRLTRAHEGSGLGLSIVKAYAESLGGRVWLNSEPGEGSTFYFSLPYAPVELSGSKSPDETTAHQKTEKPRLKKDITILVAEDDASSYMLIEALFSKQPVELLHTETGEETVKQARDNHNIDLVLMDIKLPGIDGLEATRQIRSFNPSIPIIGQSAYAMKGDREKAIEAGCNDYITKPFKRKELITLINKHTKA